MEPRWGLERQEGRRLSTKMPPPRGSLRLKQHRPAFQEINHKQICRRPNFHFDLDRNRNISVALINNQLLR